MLLSRLPLTPKGPCDLHVLRTPPAFVLSQDQTLHRDPHEHESPRLAESTGVIRAPLHSSLVKGPRLRPRAPELALSGPGPHRWRKIQDTRWLAGLSRSIFRVPAPPRWFPGPRGGRATRGATVSAKATRLARAGKSCAARSCRWRGGKTATRRRGYAPWCTAAANRRSPCRSDTLLSSRATIS